MNKTYKHILQAYVVLTILAFTSVVQADTVKIATWNMKWLGTTAGSKLDAKENVPLYTQQIKATGADLLYLQEIGATYSLNGHARNSYLDFIVQELDKSGGSWSYLLDDKNKNQRLAFLFNSEVWDVDNYATVWPGSSFKRARRPLVAEAAHEPTGLRIDLINVHFKAFKEKDASMARAENIRQLADWVNTTELFTHTLIAGDTNIYPTDAKINNGNIEQPLLDIGYIAPSDDEPTSIHENKISQRFDRFYLSPGLKDEFNYAIKEVGADAVVDALEAEDIKHYDLHISDHFPVVIQLKALSTVL